MTQHKYKHHPVIRKNAIRRNANTRRYCGGWQVFRRWGEAVWHAFNHVILTEGLCDDSGIDETTGH